MSEQTHIVEIESLVLDRVDHLHPMELQALIQREVQRALLRMELSTVQTAATNDSQVADAVARSVQQTIKAR